MFKYNNNDFLQATIQYMKTYISATDERLDDQLQNDDIPEYWLKYLLRNVG
jgi:hypothetical protein